MLAQSQTQLAQKVNIQLKTTTERPVSDNLLCFNKRNVKKDTGKLLMILTQSIILVLQQQNHSLYCASRTFPSQEAEPQNKRPTQA